MKLRDCSKLPLGRDRRIQISFVKSISHIHNLRNTGFTVYVNPVYYFRLNGQAYMNVNKLSVSILAKTVACLVEGAIMRSTSRMTGAAKNT